MKNFVQRQQSQIQGVLSGFDCLRLRGSLALLQSEGGRVVKKTQPRRKVDAATWLFPVGEMTISAGFVASLLFERNHAMSFVLQPSRTRQRIDRPWW